MGKKHDHTTHRRGHIVVGSITSSSFSSSRGVASARRCSGGPHFRTTMILLLGLVCLGGNGRSLLSVAAADPLVSSTTTTPRNAFRMNNPNLRMGGTIAQFVQELRDHGRLTDEQAMVLTAQYPDDATTSLDNHRIDPHYQPPLGEDYVLAYLADQVAQGQLDPATHTYLLTLLGLSLTEPHRFPSQQQQQRNSAAAAAPARYNGNGNVALLGRTDLSAPPGRGQIYNGVWGYTVGRREYALQGHANGLYIVDVTNPPAESLVVVQFIPMNGGDVWRDVETYQHPRDGTTYAYVAAQGSFPSSLWVINLSCLSADAPMAANSGTCQAVDRGRHNLGHTLHVATEAGLLFLNTAGFRSKGCQLFNIQADPWDPPLLPNSYVGAERDCHDSFSRGNIVVPGHPNNPRNLAYVADGYAGRWRIIDITDVATSSQPPPVLGETPAVNTRIFAHSGWLSQDSKFLFAFDELNGLDIMVFDVRDPRRVSLVRTFSYSRDGTADAIFHNGAVRGNYLLAAYYEAGLRVFDVRDPINPVEVGKGDTYVDPDGDGVPERGILTLYDGAWNLYGGFPSGKILVSDTEGGLYVYGMQESNTPPIPIPGGPTLSPVLCFPGDATCQSRRRVVVDGRTVDLVTRKKMSDLVVGDEILVDANRYEPVYGFGHKLADVDHYDFVQLTVEDSDATVLWLRLTADHMVWTEGNHAVPAARVRVGDRVQVVVSTASEPSVTTKSSKTDVDLSLSFWGGGRRLARVVQVERVSGTGVYAPLTRSGSLVVDGVRVSAFASLQGTEYVHVGYVNTGLTHHWLDQTLTLPLRVWCSDLGSCPDDAPDSYSSETGISSWMKIPHRLYLWWNHQIWVVQVMVGIPFCLFVAILAVLDVLLPLVSQRQGLVMILAVGILGVGVLRLLSMTSRFLDVGKHQISKESEKR